MSKRIPESKVYPMCCTSMYCGKYGDACNGCKHKPELDEFHEWVKLTGAAPADKTWSPLVYVTPGKVK